MLRNGVCIQRQKSEKGWLQINIVKFFQTIFYSISVFWKELASPRKKIISKGLFNVKDWLFCFSSPTVWLLRQAVISIL